MFTIREYTEDTRARHVNVDIAVRVALEDVYAGVADE